MSDAISPSMSRLAFAAVVVKQLAAYEISCVLVGGACVSIYTQEHYVSDDLDFISPFSRRRIAMALAEIGFVEEGRYFVHPEAPFYLEFPQGPIALGRRVPVEPEAVERVNGVDIHMLSPTQSVMDRLAAWYHWKDRRSLFQALDIAKQQAIDIPAIASWSQDEGEEEAYKEFLQYYEKG